jgi:hypothetical protein
MPHGYVRAVAGEICHPAPAFTSLRRTGCRAPAEPEPGYSLAAVTDEMRPPAWNARAGGTLPD